MTHSSRATLMILCLAMTASCSQNETPAENTQDSVMEATPTVPHEYGGWYCPDNLGGFPAVDILDWSAVPVVNGRMATQEETQNGTSLIFVDADKYPDARPLDMKMPRLARFFNVQSDKNELVIVIQALAISNDSIVGFRYLNGGNGSARLNEVTLLADDEIERLAPARFVQFNVPIQADADAVWSVLTSDEYSATLQATFDPENALEPDWNQWAEVNFNYPESGAITRAFAGDVWGSFYIQIDCQSEQNQYVEKFLLSRSQTSKETTLSITCGPYGTDFMAQESILEKWAAEVKKLSESLQFQSDIARWTWRIDSLQESDC